MILVDTSVIVALLDPEHPDPDAAIPLSAAIDRTVKGIARQWLEILRIRHGAMNFPHALRRNK